MAGPLNRIGQERVATKFLEERQEVEESGKAQI
jgi:hypothetical protein